MATTSNFPAVPLIVIKDLTDDHILDATAVIAIINDVFGRQEVWEEERPQSPMRVMNYEEMIVPYILKDNFKDYFHMHRKTFISRILIHLMKRICLKDLNTFYNFLFHMAVAICHYKIHCHICSHTSPVVSAPLVVILNSKNRLEIAI